MRPPSYRAEDEFEFEFEASTRSLPVLTNSSKSASTLSGCFSPSLHTTNHETLVLSSLNSEKRDEKIAFAASEFGHEIWPSLAQGGSWHRIHFHSRRDSCKAFQVSSK